VAAEITVLAPVSGRVVPLEEVPDEVFAEKLAGDGVAIVPGESGEVIAPVSGELVRLFEGGHAFGILTDEGVELIVHVGLDTVELKGEGFRRIATEGGRVEAGEPIVSFDLEVIRSAGYDPVTPVLVSNASEFPVQVLVHVPGEVRWGDELLRTDAGS
jgi:PTS system glucose-specific IIA component